MVAMLDGVHSVLCFISQPDVQKALIDACVAAGVKRYAPNEWAAYASQNSHIISCVNTRIGEATAVHSLIMRKIRSMNTCRKSTRTEEYVF